MPKNANYNTLKENIYSWAAEEQGYYITHENAGEFIKEKKEKNVSQDNSRRKSYKKYRWCNALFFTTEYKFMLHMFLLYRSFILCPTNELHVMIKENRPHRLNDVYFCHAEETVYIHVNPSIEELSWEKVHNIIMKYFFNEIEKTQNSKTHFVFYIKLKDEEIEENLSIIDIEKPKHQILKNYLYVENKVKGSGFYHLSQKARKEILKSFKNNSNKECNQLLDKLVLAINQPDSRELSNMIKSKMEQLYKLDPQDYYDYNALQKALLRWLVLYNRESDISNKNWDNFIAEEISKATDQSTSSFDNRAKNAFANAIVNSTGTCNFRSLKDFLNKTEQGNDIFNSLLENKVEYHVSSILSKTGKGVVKALEKTYDTLFKTKIPGGKETYLEFLVKKNIVPHIFGMLSRAGAKAPAALEALYKMLSSTLPGGKKETYLEFFVDNKIISNISSMLCGTGAKAPAALEALYKMFSSTLPNGNKTYLEFFVDNKIMSNISGMLNGVGAQAPAALEALYKMLSSTLPGGKETYLEFFVDNKIMSNISSMLNSVRAKAPVVLEALYKVLSSTLPNGNKTYLEFFVNNKIISNISSMLNGAGAKAPAALEALYKVLSSTLPNGNKTYLEFFVNNKIMSNISNMLHDAGAKAPTALKELCDTLFSPLVKGKKVNIAKHLEENIGQLFKTLSSNGVKYKVVSNTLKMIHDRLFEFNPNRKEWEKIDDLETLYADLDNIFKNHKKRIKIINGIKCIFNDNKDIGGVICQKANGMDLKSIEYNIQLMVKTGLKINSILDTVSIKKVLCHNNQYLSILLVNGTSSNHSVVLLKRNNTISIIDPLSAKSEFSSSLEEIRKDLMTLGVKSVNIIYSDLQQDNYAICADISLILIKNIENKLLDIRSDKDIVKIIENIKAEMYNTLPDLGQKIVSLVSEEKLQDTCGYVPKYGEHKKVWGNPMQLIGKRLIHDV